MRPLSDLEREFSFLRGMQILAEIDSIKPDVLTLRNILDTTKKMVIIGTPERTVGGDTTYIHSQNLFSLLLSLHSVLFNDCYKRKNDDKMHDAELPGTLSFEKELKLIAITNSLANEFFGEHNIVDRNKFPETYAKHYKQLCDLEPFNHGNQEVFCLFFTALTRLAREQMTFLDMRRLNEKQLLSLNPDRVRELGNNSITTLVDIFRTALDTKLEVVQPKATTPWKTTHDSVEEVSGYRYLKCTKNNINYLMTTNGGFVPLDTKFSEFSGRTLREHIDHICYLQKNSSIIKIPRNLVSWHQRPESANTTHVDGINIQDGERLLCMDTDTLTGLNRSEDKIRLERLLKREGVGLLELTIPEREKQVRESLGNDSEFNDLIDIAKEYATAAKTIIEKAVNKTFEGKTPVGKNQNHLVLTIGGAGSGKSSIGSNSITDLACGNNYVVASLDGARYFSDVYNELVKHGHHADDYMAVESFAKSIRQAVLKKAMDDGYNCLYDGSGIPWSPDYADLCAKNREKVKSITVTGAECDVATAIDRTECRLITDGRTLPMTSLLTRHVNAINSYLAVFNDPNVGNFCLYDTSGDKSANYILAKKHHIKKSDLNDLDNAKNEGKLIDALKQKGYLPEPKNLPANLEENNVDILANKVRDGQYNILVITNVSRFIRTVQKGTLDPNAKGRDQLNFIGHSGRWSSSVAMGRAENPDGTISTTRTMRI